MDEELPPDVAAAIGAVDISKTERLASVGTLICSKRQEAIAARKSSGIEDVWLSAEEAYVGMDDENRSEFEGAKWSKPTSINGPLTSKAANGGVRSRVFVPLTSRYVDAGTAKVCEITLPRDDKAFSFEPPPVPEMIDAQDDDSQVQINGQPAMRDATDDDQPPASPLTPAAPQGPQGPVPLTVKDLAQEHMDKATDSAKKAEKRIYTWMVGCQYTGEMRKVVHDAARLGSGVLKGPFPEKTSAKAMTGDKGTMKLEIVEKIKPSVKWVDLWNFFPDASCGENIHHGSYVFERDFLSERRVTDLIGQPGYIESQLRIAIEAGPDGKVNTDGANPANKGQYKDSRYTVWYFTGVLTYKDMESLGAVGLDNVSKDKKDVYAVVTLINDTPVKATINPLESGEFNYHAMAWRRRTGHWAGVGIAEQIATPQRMTNAATRLLMSNTGKSAGSQVVLQRGMVEPADGLWSLTPDKLWYLKVDASLDDVRKAFATFEIPNKTDQILKVIEYALKLAEEATNIPLISQGQSGGPSSPDTYGAAQLQDNNANQLLRSIGEQLDTSITEPVVRQFYEWLLLDPDVPEDEKAEWTINAHGSAALVERHIQSQVIAQMVPMVENAAFGIDPARYFKALAKAQRLDPRDFCYTDAEMAQKQSQPPAPPPQVTVAQIRAHTDLQVAKTGADRDTLLVQAEASRNKVEADYRIQELSVRRELALLEYANKKDVTLEQIKAGLAETSIKENTRKELAAAELAVSQQESMLNRTHSKIMHNEQLGHDQQVSDADTLSKNVLRQQVVPGVHEPTGSMVIRPAA